MTRRVANAWNGLRLPIARVAAVVAAVVLAGCAGGEPNTRHSPEPRVAEPAVALRLPTGARLDPAGRSIAVGNMPMGAVLAPDGRHVVVSLSGWREQGIEVVDLQKGRVVQRVAQPGAFLGLAWSPDGDRLYASGGVSDCVYVYGWRAADREPATLVDSLALAPADPKTPGSRYPAGMAMSSDGHYLFVAENMSDSLAVLDLRSRRVVQRVGVGSYPYAVAVSPDRRVYASAWGGDAIAVFDVDSTGSLVPRHPIDAGRHPSALLINRTGSRLFAASASTDRVAVIDPRANRVVCWLGDPPPGGVSEGSTPNALALSPDGSRLYVAEADNNAVAVFELSAESAGDSAVTGTGTLAGRIPAEWYPTAVIDAGDSLCVVSGKGRGTGPNPTGPQPNVPLLKGDVHGYVLGQLNGTVDVVPAARGRELGDLSVRVTRANGWDTPRATHSKNYPPFEHVVYVIKENRTFDQIFGDLTQADGDTALLFFPRSVSPNHHALAERFGIFDRFFTNAEVSMQGHPWSTAGYVTDFLEKTMPDVYRFKRPERDETGDADDPVAGYVWDAAIRKGITLRDYGEYVEAVDADDAGPARTRALIASLAPYTNPSYPAFDMTVSDQHRADVWIDEFREYEKSGHMPALEIMSLPGDHTAGARAGRPTPKAYFADNDLALGRIVEALSRSRFWRSTVVFVLEDDSQAGPDHVDSHRSAMLVISAWNRAGVSHRFANTTDVLATIEEILGLESMSQFDHFSRPLREIWTDRPDLRPYVALTPAQSLEEMNVATGQAARASANLDFSRADRVDDDEFNHILWGTIKGSAPYPAAQRVSLQEYARSR